MGGGEGTVRRVGEDTRDGRVQLVDAVFVVADIDRAVRAHRDTTGIARGSAAEIGTGGGEDVDLAFEGVGDVDVTRAAASRTGGRYRHLGFHGTAFAGEDFFDAGDGVGTFASVDHVFARERREGVGFPVCLEAMKSLVLEVDDVDVAAALVDRDARWDAEFGLLDRAKRFEEVVAAGKGRGKGRNREQSDGRDREDEQSLSSTECAAEAIGLALV
jgi:hypothetical protein